MESSRRQQLRHYSDRLDRLDEEIKALQQDKSEVYAEAKSEGFETKALRQVRADLKKHNARDNTEFDFYELYWRILGEEYNQSEQDISPKIGTSRARAHEGIREARPDIEPETLSTILGDALKDTARTEH